ncbi:MAG: putative bifunctional diguanylate cyclase/phosphodiesterase, partial [Dehalococcoidia bacterium]
DPLTASPNRALLTNRRNQARAAAGRQQGVVAILFLDLDEFKLINDSLGHAVGDLLLTAVARRCSGYLRASDTLARFGGNEFLILIPHTTISSVPTHVAERILTALRQPFAIDGREIFITASLGVAIHHGAAGSTEPGDLLRQADIALYQAKAAGKARLVIFDPSMSAWARERLDLETDLRHAVERQELLLHYQPIVDVPSGSIIGMEALLRWQHPQRGLLGPMQFIPIAEQTELILPIGRWVLEQACRQAQAWRGLRTEGPPLVMSVNLSAREFQQRDLTEHVRQVLEETGLEPEMVELEITRAS